MIYYNQNDIEKDSTYSFLLGRLESPELEDITSVASKLLQLFDNSEGKDNITFPSESTENVIVKGVSLVTIIELLAF